MLGFDLSDEQRMIRDLARKFSLEEIRPKAAQYDASGEFPIDLLKRANELGLMNELIPEAYGGPGMGIMESCIITEQLSYGCAGIGTSIMINNLGMLPVSIAGSHALKEKYLTRVSKEFSISAFAMTEPGAGSDAAAVATSAVKDGNHYILNGTKRFITNGAHAQYFSVLAVTDKARRHHGKSAFVVERGMPGVSTGKKEDKMGQRASDTSEVILEDVRVPKENLIGREGEGFQVFMRTLDRSRPMIAASATGLAQAALDYALQYARERRQFGRSIAEFQAVQFMLADMARDIEASRLLTWQAAWLVDHGKSASRQSSIAKLFAADTAMRVTTDAVQIYGGYGYMKDYPVEKLMRDAKILQIYEGTSQIQRVVITRELLQGRSSAP